MSPTPWKAGSGNSRNGSFAKTVTPEIGEVPIQVPRDRNGTFDPKLVPHGTRRLDGLEAQVISLYASGLTTGEIQGHLEEIYGTSVSRDTVSRITDAIVADMEAWQSRPLDAIYAGVLIDAIVIKVRDTQVANRPVYVAIGVNLDGERDTRNRTVPPIRPATVGVSRVRRVMVRTVDSMSARPWSRTGVHLTDRGDIPALRRDCRYSHVSARRPSDRAPPTATASDDLRAG
jgi:hypothetical protein